MGMISKPAWRVSELSQEAFNASRPFSFKSHQQVVFVNTGDVLAGKFLHANISEAKGLPGQAKKALRRDDILLTEIRPGNGRFAYVNFNPEKYVVSTKFLVIESYGRVIPRFLYHVLTNQSALDEFQRIAESRSGTFPQITFESIAHFPVPVPPQQIQEELTRFFDSIENRITLLRETNITLESIAQALFKSWFVDFDPVNSKQAGREPEGMDTATAALFLAEFEESALGLIPRGWTVKRLGELVELVYGKALKATDRKDGAVPVYGSGGITGFHDEALVPHGSVIVGRKGTVGSLYWEERPFFPIDTTFYVRPTAAPLTFCYYAMQRLGLESMNTDAAVPGLNRENAYRLEFVVPTDAVLDSFDNIAAAIRNSIHANSRRAETLADVRDLLLPRLISGKLRLPEAQEQLEDALA